MTTLNVTNEVANELEKLLLVTDKIKEVEPTTEKHYTLNLRFEVERENKKYFIAIKKVDVLGSEVKSHVRLEVDTDLPSNEKLKKQQKKQENKRKDKNNRKNKNNKEKKSTHRRKYNIIKKKRKLILLILKIQRKAQN